MIMVVVVSAAVVRANKIGFIVAAVDAHETVVMVEAV